MRKAAKVDPTEVYEDIVEYVWHVSGIVRVSVAKGWMEEGEFRTFPSQNLEMHQIMYEDYEELMAEKGSKPKGEFRKEDLWEFVDRVRSGTDALTRREARGRITQDAITR